MEKSSRCAGHRKKEAAEIHLWVILPENLLWGKRASKPSHTPALLTEFRGHLPLHKQPRSDLQKAPSLLIVQARSIPVQALCCRGRQRQGNKIIILQRGHTEAFPSTAASPALLQGTAAPVVTTAGAVLLHRPRECHTLHTPQSGAPVTAHSLRELQNLPPHEAAQQHHRHIINPKPQDRRWLSGSCRRI